jgi:hypothetical protein
MLTSWVAKMGLIGCWATKQTIIATLRGTTGRRATPCGRYDLLKGSPHRRPPPSCRLSHAPPSAPSSTSTSPPPLRWQVAPSGPACRHPPTSSMAGGGKSLIYPLNPNLAATMRHYPLLHWLSATTTALLSSYLTPQQEGIRRGRDPTTDSTIGFLNQQCTMVP